MTSVESMFFWAGLVGYALATLLFFAGLVFRIEKLMRVGGWIAVISFGFHTASIIVRWLSSGRPPYIQAFENALAGTWFVVGAWLLVVWRVRSARAAGIVVLPFSLLAMGYGLTLPIEPGPVTPAYKSIWLVIHVMFAWATYAAYSAAAGLAVMELLKTRRGGPSPGSVVERFPDVSRMQELTFRLVAFGFLVNGVMIASGAVWAFELWGSYWRWDPVETWSLLTWLAYAFYLHAWLTLGWRGRRLAWIAFLALFGVLMAFWGVQLLPSSYHLFDDLGGTILGTGRGTQ